MEINEMTSDMKLARDLIWDGENVFITGGAGVGKSTFIKSLKNEGLNFLFLAPTGLIAANGVVKGSTLHSFFKIPFNYADIKMIKPISPWNLQILKGIDSIVIDEVSMVRSDVFEFIDASLKYAMKIDKPFGGKQIILVGDLFQLPPIVASKAEKDMLNDMFGGKYFFQAPSFENAKIKTIEFKKTFRQQDETFISILNGIKTGEISDEQLAVLNSRVGKGGEDNLIVTTMNRNVDSHNLDKLYYLSGQEHVFAAKVTGDFNFKNTRLNNILELKEGCRVMITVNGDGYSNGSLGTFEGTDEDETLRIRRDSDGRVMKIGKHTQHNVSLAYDKDNKKITENILGSCTQYPVSLAYAITSHKCQGMTFDSCTFDKGGGIFDSGQLYVSLSRCRTFEGLTLTREIERKDIIVDSDVCDFYKNR